MRGRQSWRHLQADVVAALGGAAEYRTGRPGHPRRSRVLFAAEVPDWSASPVLEHLELFDPGDLDGEEAGIHGAGDLGGERNGDHDGDVDHGRHVVGVEGAAGLGDEDHAVEVEVGE